MKQPLSFIQKIAEQAAAAAGATVTAGQILACTTRLAVPVAPVQLQTKSPTPQLSEGGSPAARGSVSAQNDFQRKLIRNKRRDQRHSGGGEGRGRGGRYPMSFLVLPLISSTSTKRRQNSYE